MLSKTIIEMIETKYGKKNLQSGDCASLAGSIGVGETTVKRMLGLVGADSPERNRTPRVSTYDLLAKWLGYDDYRALLIELNEGDVASEFTSMHSIETAALAEGTQIQLRYEPARVMVMTYLGNDEFMINESQNSKLLKGDRIWLTHLVLGQEVIIREVRRGERNLGGYRAAKDGGLTYLEIIA